MIFYLVKFYRLLLNPFHSIISISLDKPSLVGTRARETQLRPAPAQNAGLSETVGCHYPPPHLYYYIAPIQYLSYLLYLLSMKYKTRLTRVIWRNIKVYLLKIMTIIHGRGIIRVFFTVFIQFPKRCFCFVRDFKWRSKNNNYNII